MHELALCESVLQIIEEEAGKQGFTRVKSVFLEIGELSCVEPEAMRFSFDVVMKNTLADQALLTIISAPGVAWCRQCSKEVRVKQRYDHCPDCGQYQLRLVSGDEMRVKELEVE